MLETNTSGRTTVAGQASSPNGNMAILGVNRIAEKLYAEIKTDSAFVGFISIDKESNDAHVARLGTILGNVEQLEHIVKAHAIGSVMLAVDPKDIQTLHELIQKCETQKLSYEVLSRDYDVTYQPALSELLPNEVESESDNLPEVQKELWFQRAVDLLVSISMFLFFLPSYVLVAAAIKLESRGNVLYSQERVGKNGKIFKIFKFRSMYSDAEKRGPQLATKSDPRITRIGRILRKTRIDELPQLVNVIRGDMSLVGPRPERPYFVEKYSTEIPDYKMRLTVKPGLTGWAQVTTGYDESLEDVKEKVRHDIHYIHNRSSVKLYFEIVLKTIWVVLTAKGQ